MAQAQEKPKNRGRTPEMKFSWREVFAGGAIVDLEIAYWTGAQGLIDQDLGLNLSATTARVVQLGFKKLIPSRAVSGFKRVENASRRVIERNSRKFPGVGRRFVPASVLAEVVKELDRQKKAFYEEVEKFLAGYEKLKEATRPLFRQFVQEMWDLVKQGSDFPTYDAYYKAFMRRLEEAYPDVEELRERFFMDYLVYEIKSPELDAAAEVTERVRQEESAKARQVYTAFINEARAGVRSAVQKLLDVVNDNGSVKSQSLDAVRRTFERFRTLDVIGDQDLTDEITALEKEVLDEYEYSSFRTDSSALDALRAGLSRVVEKTKSIADADVVKRAARFTAIGSRTMELD